MTSFQQPKVLLPREQIRDGVVRLAQEISRDYKGTYPLLLGILKGCFVFMADLVRLLEIPVEIDFVRLVSYGSARVTSGKVRLVQGLRSPIRGRDVLVIEDIVDTGTAMGFFMDYLRKRKPASLKLCALFDKPSRRRVPVSIDYLGFTLPDKFVVGYGLDYDERYRHLPDLCVLED
ncbi:MAG: hypoxanthine phosphoribosyltransferase [Chloroflexi bacterium]|nr:MAG: hypoxanthine phosphoribosyltransferase [Chloroflexota bacterium]